MFSNNLVTWIYAPQRMGTECSKLLDSLPAEPPGNPQGIVTRDFNKAFNTNCNKRMIWLFAHSWRQMKASQEPSGSWGKAFQRGWTQLEHALFIFPLSWTPFSITWKEVAAAAAIVDHEATWRMEGATASWKAPWGPQSWLPAMYCLQLNLCHATEQETSLI